MEEQHGHQHDPDRRSIEKDRRGGKRHHGNGGKIAYGEKQNAPEPQPEEKRKIPQSDPEARSVFDQQNDAEKQRCQRNTDRNDLHGSEAVLCQSSDKDPHAAPEASCQDNQQRADVAFALLHAVSVLTCIISGTAPVILSRVGVFLKFFRKNTLLNVSFLLPAEI